MSLAIYIGTAIGVLLWLLWFLRRDSLSLGLPLAYIIALLLIHVPGAVAHVVGSDVLRDSDLTEAGMRLTAIGALCFAGGVYLARRSVTAKPPVGELRREEFWFFCLYGGWFLTFGLSFLSAVPSLGAAVNKGAAVWMLGAMLGLRAAIGRRDLRQMCWWIGALFVYPVAILFIGAFLSYGSTAIIIVSAALAVSARRYWRVVAGIVVIGYVGLSVFVVYFEHRSSIRQQVWGGAALEKRIESVRDAAEDFRWLSLRDAAHLRAFDLRLNQNYFVGLAYTRLQNGDVDYLHGRSVWEGLLALVPRAMWPEKPVFGGSPAIVGEMTGLRLSVNTSFGVGNVLEFYANFGLPGLAGGFVLLGWLLGFLDLKAAIAERQGDFGTAVLCFLPAVALIQPNGSAVEMFGGVGAALIAGWSWSAAWNQWANRAGQWSKASGSRSHPVNMPGRS